MLSGAVSAVEAAAAAERAAFDLDRRTRSAAEMQLFAEVQRDPKIGALAKIAAEGARRFGELEAAR